MKKTRHFFLKSQGYTSINLKKTSTNHYQIEATINNIKGIVIKEKQAVIEVKETDKATFPSTNLDI